jgi:hypothetical protein
MSHQIVKDHNMEWESSIVYERIINEEVQRRLGGIHSADLLIRSCDFAVVEKPPVRGRVGAGGTAARRGRSPAASSTRSNHGRSAPHQRLDPALVRIHDLPDGHLTSSEHPDLLASLIRALRRRAEGNQPS